MMLGLRLSRNRLEFGFKSTNAIKCLSLQKLARRFPRMYP